MSKKKTITQDELMAAWSQLAIPEPEPGYLPLFRIQELWNCSEYRARYRLSGMVKLGKALRKDFVGRTPGGRTLVTPHYKLL